MKPSLHVALRPSETIYVNGAAIRVDRKVSLEFLNDVTFLLGNHALSQDEATTPLRQHYLVIQSMLIDPSTIDGAMNRYRQSREMIEARLAQTPLLPTLRAIDASMAQGRRYEALKALRALFPLEAALASEHSNDDPTRGIR